MSLRKQGGRCRVECDFHPIAEKDGKPVMAPPRTPDAGTEKPEHARAAARQDGWRRYGTKLDACPECVARKA